MNMLREHAELFKKCPKSSKVAGGYLKSRSTWLLFPLIGFLGLIWYMIRVIPKPSRAAYPCMKVVAPLASSFVAYLVSLGVVIWAGRRLPTNLRRRRLVLSAVCLVALAAGLIIHADLQSRSTAAEVAASGIAYTPSDPPNTPMGVAKGINPGRVVWVRDAKATTWDGRTGNWWSDANVNQAAVNQMVSKSLQTLTGAATDREAWDKIFRFYNREHGRGEAGYKRGEKIVIKINCNVDSSGKEWSNTGYPSPQAIYAVVSQLIDVAGVAGDNITIAEPSRNIGDPIYGKITGNPNPEYQNVWFASTKAVPGTRRVIAAPDPNTVVYCDPTSGGKKHNLPKCYAEATYMINLALLRPHRVYGVTLCAKNHFGSIYDGKTFTPAALHNYALWDLSHNKLGDPHCHPGLIGHKDLGGKTILYMLDGLYTSYNNWGNASIKKWQTLGDEWCASILASQDPVAIDSVGLDLIRNEPNLTTGNPGFTPNVCNYLHEAAQANQPPSGAVYDPEKTGKKLPSLGAHEHWNNAKDKKYSRNLGTGNGIELVHVGPGPLSPRP
jgi:hypothetical protein